MVQTTRPQVIYEDIHLAWRDFCTMSSILSLSSQAIILGLSKPKRSYRAIHSEMAWDSSSRVLNNSAIILSKADSEAHYTIPTGNINITLYPQGICHLHYTIPTYSARETTPVQPGDLVSKPSPGGSTCSWWIRLEIALYICNFRVYPPESR